MATVGVTGMIVVGGRWALRTGAATVFATLPVAVIRPTDPIWFVALSITAGMLLLLPIVTQRIRKLPSATGPPSEAVLVALILAGTPAAIGFAAWNRPTTATVIVGLSAPLAALWYSRVLPGGLYVVRIIWPLITTGLVRLQTAPVAIVSVVTAIVVLAMAWRPEVAVAFHPPRETGRVYPVPPELVPKEILDAAELDEKGRRR
jgi:hypothetical protein